MKIIKQWKQTKQSKTRLPFHVYLAYLLVCTFLLTGVSFSRYISSASGSGSARVTKGVVTVSYDKNNTQFEMTRPSDDGVEERAFEFKVSNDTSEVAIRYDVVVTLDKPLKPGITMTLDGQPGTAGVGNTYMFSNVGTFAAGVKEIKTHILSFSGNFQEISPETDDTYEIQILIHSQQID